jgi:hypothetical protein
MAEWSCSNESGKDKGSMRSWVYSEALSEHLSRGPEKIKKHHSLQLASGQTVERLK